MPLTPSTVRSGHSVNAWPAGRSRASSCNPALVKAVRQCRRRAHNNSPVPVSFNSTWPAGEPWIRQNFAPAGERFGLSKEFYLYITAGLRPALIAVFFRRKSSRKILIFKDIWLGAESNRRHEDFQSSALPTELPSRVRQTEQPIWNGEVPAQVISSLTIEYVRFNLAVVGSTDFAIPKRPVVFSECRVDPRAPCIHRA
jgi:hypothetical protein